MTDHDQSHTILGTKSQRGLTQMTLDVLFRSIGSNVRQTHNQDMSADSNLLTAIQNSDNSEAQVLSATSFLDIAFDTGDRARMSRAQTPMAGYGSRSQTPMTVWNPHELPSSFPSSPPPLSRKSPYTDVRDLFPQDATSLSHADRDDRFPTASTGGTHGPPRYQASSTAMEFQAPRDSWHPLSKVPFWSRFTPKRACAKIKFIQDSMPNYNSRRPPLPQSSTFAQQPDVSGHLVDIDRDADYVVLVSMYEVYNDRIFDLLSTANSSHGPAMSTRAAAALQKGLMRRPLLFKNTEMSPDRKVVAGLRKIICNNYNEAMMVLEAGLLERRVAGTGSNSVSSRSHGFFCIEVKKNTGNRHYHSYSDWTSSTLSIADLAGSERARNAKTTGSTLAEAGKINESLMYLGQCLQVQSDCQQDGSKPIVPFRQCKLTELLFSNSFPSQTNQNAIYRAPQKAIMIVTADPEGDFNATSQILRYSALAREVTVPRIPSVASVIVNSGKPSSTVHTPGERATPTDQYFSSLSQELEQATNEVQRLAEECNALAVKLAEEEIKRTEAEFRLQAVEERSALAEQEIREECWQEMEFMMEEEKERWRNAWEEQKIRSEEYLDGKIDILEKTSQFKIHTDISDSVRVDELERENESLRARLSVLEQELVIKSPTKKSKISTKPLVLQEASNTNVATNPFLASLKSMETDFQMKPLAAAKGEEVDVFDISPRKLSLRSSSATRLAPDEPETIMKKPRKLTTRKWDLGDENEI